MRTAAAMLTAVLLLMSCVSNQPNNELSSLYSSLGDAYYRLEEYKKAVGAYQSALVYDKKNDSIKYNLSRAYVENGQTTEAFDLVNELLEKDPENGILLETKAYILLQKGHVGEAKDVYLKLLELVPNHPNALYNSYLIAAKEEEFQLAVEYLEKYYSSAEKDAQAYLLLAKAEEKAGNEKKKLEYYEESAKLGNTEALEFLAAWYADQKEFKKAVSEYETLMNVKDYDFKFYMKMAEIYLFDIEDFASGKKYMELAKENNQLNMASINGRLQDGDYLWQDELKEFLATLTGQ